MRIVVGPDQLHVDVHPVASLLNTALEHIGDAQLSCDLRQIFRRRCCSARWTFVK